MARDCRDGFAQKINRPILRYERDLQEQGEVVGVSAPVFSVFIGRPRLFVGGVEQGRKGETAETIFGQ